MQSYFSSYGRHTPLAFFYHSITPAALLQGHDVQLFHVCTNDLLTISIAALGSLVVMMTYNKPSQLHAEIQCMLHLTSTS